ncbi:MAG: TonB-dependent receptor, partial [Schleiferiaceae bacterium]|nr:TonB-dependent receptor [Schleiferiaceae bacterium]
MKYLFFFVSIVLSFSVIAQNPRGNADSFSGELFGQIIDSTNSEVIEYAAVSLFNSDNNLVNGGMTNEKGKFNLKEIKKGTYSLIIQFVGYNSKTISNISFTDSRSVINLGNIALKADNALDEIVLDGSTPTIKYDIDKKVIDVSKLEVDLGQSATEILENTPSITVDIDGTVSLRGSSSFTLLINGRPTAMDPSTALSTIPASSIKNIEIITNPSAKYEAEGVSGIMNIVTKSDKLEGVSMLANLTGGNYNNYSGDVSVNVRGKKTEFNIGLDHRNRSRPTDNYTERFSDFDTLTTRVVSNGLSDWGGSNSGINGEFTYTPTTAHSFTLGTRLNQRQMVSPSELYFQEYTDDVEVYSYYNDGLATFNITSNSTYLNYRFNVNRDKEHYLEFRGVYNYRYGDDIMQQDYLDSDGVKTGGTRNTEKGPSGMFRFNLDYSKKFESGLSVEAGSQIQFGKSIDETRNYDYNALTGEYELQEQFSADAHYTRDIAGFYGLAKGKSNKLGYQLGLRAEYTYRTIAAENVNQFTEINRLDWFPTVHLSYELPKNNQLLLNYTRRIQRPRSWYLEPFISWRNAYSIYSGNPDLLPEYVDAFELNWNKSLQKKGNVSIETYARIVNNYISRVEIPYDTNIIMTTPLNVGKTISVGMEPTFSYKLFDWWKTDIAFNLFHYTILSQHEQLESSENFNWNSRWTNTFPLNGNWNIQIASRYIGAANTVQGRKDGYFTANGSVRKSFSQNKYAVIFQIRDIFSTIENRNFTTTGNV